MDHGTGKTMRFTLHGMVFEYDEQKSIINYEKHGITFKNAALVFLDYNRVELFDEMHSAEEDRYQTIGCAEIHENLSTGTTSESYGTILFVVYTERTAITQNGKEIEVTRIISAREATSFERGIYYGKYN